MNNLDDIIGCVDSDAICAAMKDLFEDVRVVAGCPARAGAGGMKKYIAQHNISAVANARRTSFRRANVNFHGLRYV